VVPSIGTVVHEGVAERPWDRRLVKRARVRQALDGDERRQGVVDALLKEDPELWARYLSR
jgi:hypothetical protein